MKFTNDNLKNYNKNNMDLNSMYSILLFIYDNQKFPIKNKLDSWQWQHKDKNNPPLKQQSIVKLFRSNLVKESNNQMILTTTGINFIENHLKK